jgi:hypothetical protein
MVSAIFDFSRCEFKRIRGGRGLFVPDFSLVDQSHSQCLLILLDDLDGEEHAGILGDALVEVDLDAVGKCFGYLVQTVLDFGEG